MDSVERTGCRTFWKKIEVFEAMNLSKNESLKLLSFLKNCFANSELTG